MLSLSRSAVLICLFATVCHADILTGLRAYYPFDTGLSDAGANHFPTTPHGGVTLSSTGRVGGCATFDGTSGWLEVSHGGALSFDLDTGSYTVAAWVRVVAPTTQGTIAQDRYGANVAVSYSIAYDPTVGLDRWVFDSWWGPACPGASNCTQATKSSFAGDVGAWHHVATVHNASSHWKGLYFDGVLVGQAIDCVYPSPCNNFPTPGASNATTTVGGYWGSAGEMANFFKGDIDELRFYDRALSPADVQELVSAGSCVPPVALTEGFEADSVGAFPGAWRSRFAGVGQSVVSNVFNAGAKSLRQAAGGANAAEVHSAQTFACGAGVATLDFALRWSSESTNTGPDCDDIYVAYQGAHGAFRSGFVRDASGTLVVVGTNMPVQQNRWYHFHGVADYDRGSVAWYVDDARISACQAFIPGATGADRANRLELHVGCIANGQSVAYFDSISFVPGRACAGDSNGDGQSNVADIFDFLTRWFAGCN